MFFYCFFRDRRCRLSWQFCDWWHFWALVCVVCDLKSKRLLVTSNVDQKLTAWITWKMYLLDPFDAIFNVLFLSLMAEWMTDHKEHSDPRIDKSWLLKLLGSSFPATCIAEVVQTYERSCRDYTIEPLQEAFNDSFFGYIVAICFLVCIEAKQSISHRVQRSTTWPTKHWISIRVLQRFQNIFSLEISSQFFQQCLCSKIHQCQ